MRPIAHCGTTFLVMTGAWAGSSRAQPPHVVSPSDFAARGLPIRADTVDGLVGDKEKQTYYGYYVYAVAPSSLGARPVYLVTMNYSGGSSERLFQSDTLAVDGATLAPLWRHFHARTDSASIVYSGRHATGWALQNGRNVAVDRQLSDNAFDAAVVRWIVPLLPLVSGYQATITAFNMWKNAENASTISVTGTEVVQVRDKKYDAWILASTTGLRRWVDRATGVIVQAHSEGTLGGRGAWEV